MEKPLQLVGGFRVLVVEACVQRHCVVMLLPAGWWVGATTWGWGVNRLNRRSIGRPNLSLSLWFFVSRACRAWWGARVKWFVQALVPSALPLLRLPVPSLMRMSLHTKLGQ